MGKNKSFNMKLNNKKYIFAFQKSESLVIDVFKFFFKGVVG